MLGAFSVAKFAAQLVTTLGAAKVVSEVVKNNVAIPTTIVNKTLVWSGSTAIGLLVADKSAEHVGTMIDTVASKVTNRQDEAATETEKVES